MHKPPRNALTTATALAAKASQAAAIKRQAAKLGIKINLPSKKVQDAIRLMVFSGLRREQAAEQAGMSDLSFRAALNRTNSLAYLDEQKEVLRKSAGAEGLHMARELMHDQKQPGRTRLAALEVLERIGEGSRPNMQTNVQVNVVTPGYVIDMRDEGKAGDQITHLDLHAAKPLISLDDVAD